MYLSNEEKQSDLLILLFVLQVRKKYRLFSSVQLSETIFALLWLCMSDLKRACLKMVSEVGADLFSVG